MGGGGEKEWPNVERGRREIETVAMSLKPSVRRCAGGWRDIHVRPDDDRPGLFNSLASHGCVRAMPARRGRFRGRDSATDTRRFGF